MKTIKIILALALTFSFVNAFNQMYVKNTTGDDDGDAVFSEKLGIGVEPAYPFHLLSPSGNTGLAVGASGENSLIRMHISTADYGYLNMGDGQTVLRSHGNKCTFAGDVGIGTITPSEKLDVAGNVRLLSNHWTNGLQVVPVTINSYNMPAIMPVSPFYGSLGYGLPSFGYAYIDHIYYDNLTDYSDETIKENITEISDVKDKLIQLNPVKYDIKESFYDSVKIYDKEKIDEKRKNKVGLIAQDVQKIFPDLVVKDDATGLLGVNYIDLIPYMLTLAKEQQLQIEELEEIIGNCCSIEENKKSGGNHTANIPVQTSSYIEQNIPNPFNENTEIKYFIEESVKKATIYIYNMQGYQIDSYEIMERGESSLMIYGQTMMPGMYLYTLIADGKEIDTKKMILTD